MISPSGFSETADRLGDELRAAFDRVLRSGWYVLGGEVEAFEQEFAAWLGAEHCVGVASGTDALQLALTALGVGPGDEVIVPSNSLPTAYGVAATGCTIRFCDARLDDYCLDPADVARLMTPRTRAVIAVHLYGHPADVPALRSVLAGRPEVAIVEDCAQAHGASLGGRRAGTLGDVAAFSFYPTKNLGALGDGGAIVCADPELAERARRLRVYGEATRYNSVELGTNSRLDELQAALLRVKLPYLDAALERRRAIAALYDRLLDGVATMPPARPDAVHARHLYPIWTPARDPLLAELRAAGVPAAVHYPRSAHDQPCFSAQRERNLPVCESLARSLVSLPIHPELTDEQVCAVADAVRRGHPSGLPLPALVHVRA